MFKTSTKFNLGLGIQIKLAKKRKLVPDTTPTEMRNPFFLAFLIVNGIQETAFVHLTFLAICVKVREKILQPFHQGEKKYKKKSLLCVQPEEALIVYRRTEVGFY
jgi:hypothetical protein